MTIKYDVAVKHRRRSEPMQFEPCSKSPQAARRHEVRAALWLCGINDRRPRTRPANGAGFRDGHRPTDITESSIVVPKGSLQVENGLTWTDYRRYTTVDLSETLMRFGISDRSELRIVIPNYLESLTGPVSASGFFDVVPGMKHQFRPLSGEFDLSVIVALSIPAGADRISSHGYDPFIKFPWSKDLKAGSSIGGMESLFWYTEDRRRNLTGESTFYVEKQITKPSDPFAEYGGDFQQRGGSKDVAHFGSAYKITPKNQIDFHFGFGLSHSAPGRFFAVGYSFELTTCGNASADRSSGGTSMYL